MKKEVVLLETTGHKVRRAVREGEGEDTLGFAHPEGSHLILSGQRQRHAADYRNAVGVMSV